MSSADDYEAFARGELAVVQDDGSDDFYPHAKEPRFRLCPSSGQPAHPGGAQSLTPLWLPGGGAAPSQAHVASLAQGRRGRGTGRLVGAAPAGFLRAGDRA